MGGKHESSKKIDLYCKHLIKNGGGEVREWSRGKGDVPRTYVVSGIALKDTSVLNISGNTFSNLSTKALTIEGKPARQVIFSNNLLVNTEGGFDALEESKVKGNFVVKGAR